MKKAIDKDRRGEYKMLRNFKLRLLLVIFLVAITGWGLQSGNSNRDLVEPVIKYILTDYGVEQRIAEWSQNLWPSDSESAVPTASETGLQLPCEYISIEQDYGWQWQPEQKKQEFSPGVLLQVKDNTLIKPVMAGQVMKLSSNEYGRTVLVKHDDNLFSLYGGLKEILVEEGSKINANHILGKTGEHLYIEIRNREGPQDPQQLFK